MMDSSIDSTTDSDVDDIIRLAPDSFEEDSTSGNDIPLSQHLPGLDDSFTISCDGDLSNSDILISSIPIFLDEDTQLLSSNSGTSSPSSNNLSYNINYKSEKNKDHSKFILPASFFDIPSNLENLAQCKPLCIKLFDCAKMMPKAIQNPYTERGSKIKLKSISDIRNDIKHLKVAQIVPRQIKDYKLKNTDRSNYTKDSKEKEGKNKIGYNSTFKPVHAISESTKYQTHSSYISITDNSVLEDSGHLMIDTKDLISDTNLKPGPLHHDIYLNSESDDELIEISSLPIKVLPSALTHVISKNICNKKPTQLIDPKKNTGIVGMRVAHRKGCSSNFAESSHTFNDESVKEMDLTKKQKKSYVNSGNESINISDSILTNKPHQLINETPISTNEIFVNSPINNMFRINSKKKSSTKTIHESIKPKELYQRTTEVNQNIIEKNVKEKENISKSSIMNPEIKKIRIHPVSPLMYKSMQYQRIEDQKLRKKDHPTLGKSFKKAAKRKEVNEINNQKNKLSKERNKVPGKISSIVENPSNINQSNQKSPRKVMSKVCADQMKPVPLIPGKIISDSHIYPLKCSGSVINSMSSHLSLNASISNRFLCKSRNKNPVLGTNYLKTPVTDNLSTKQPCAEPFTKNIKKDIPMELKSHSNNECINGERYLEIINTKNDMLNILNNSINEADIDTHTTEHYVSTPTPTMTDSLFIDIPKIENSNGLDKKNKSLTFYKSITDSNESILDMPQNKTEETVKFRTLNHSVNNKILKVTPQKTITAEQRILTKVSNHTLSKTKKYINSAGRNAPQLQSLENNSKIVKNNTLSVEPKRDRSLEIFANNNIKKNNCNGNNYKTSNVNLNTSKNSENSETIQLAREKITVLEPCSKRFKYLEINMNSGHTLKKLSSTMNNSTVSYISANIKPPSVNKDVLIDVLSLKNESDKKVIREVPEIHVQPTKAVANGINARKSVAHISQIPTNVKIASTKPNNNRIENIVPAANEPNAYSPAILSVENFQKTLDLICKKQRKKPIESRIKTENNNSNTCHDQTNKADHRFKIRKISIDEYKSRNTKKNLIKK